MSDLQTARRPRATTLLFLPLVAGAVTYFIVLALLWQDATYFPLPPGGLAEHLHYWLIGLAFKLTHGLAGTRSWSQYVAWFDALPSGQRWGFFIRLTLALIAGSGIATLTFLHLLHGRGDKPLRGRTLRQGATGMRLLKAEAAKEFKPATAGIHLHPEVQISQLRETKHVLVMGTSGSGKTHVLQHLVNEARRRDDRVILVDSKGDFTAQLSKIGLIAPWDARSLAWDIAADCPGILDAKTLSARLIPTNDKDPMWSNASREVLTTLILYLQDTQPESWTFTDLRTALNLPIPDLRVLADRYNPEALRSLEDGSKTTQSILINTMAFMAPVVDFARAWPAGSKVRRFSMRHWLKNSNSTMKTLVIQSSIEYETTSTALINALISVVAGTIASPSLPDDPNRRIWLILDEFPQLGRLKDIGALIRMGRSKGLRIVLGVQDIAELRNIYGTHQTDAWASSFTTSIYTRLEGGETAEWVSKRIGDKEIEEQTVSKTKSEQGISESVQTHRKRTPAVLPSELKSLLGTRQNGVDALIDGFDEAVYLVNYPYLEPKIRRPGVVLANWVQGAQVQTAAIPAPGMPKLPEPPAQEVGCLPTESSSATPTESEPAARAVGKVPDSPSDHQSHGEYAANSPNWDQEPTAQAVASRKGRRWAKRSGGDDAGGGGGGDGSDDGAAFNHGATPS